MRITYVQMIAQFIASILHLVLAYHFVFEKNMDVKGLGLAISIANFSKTAIVVVFICLNKEIRKSVTMMTMNAFAEWREYLGYSIPVIIILCSEWWAYEVITVLAGLIGVEEQACQTIVSIVLSCFFEFPLAVSEVTSSLVGNCIGAGNVELAKRFYRMTSLIALFVVTSVIGFIFLARFSIVELCTKSEAV